MKVTILGCGPSGGVPLVGNIWGQCDPNDPKNRRLRTSALISHGEINLLIDTSTDLRQQLLNAEVKKVHGVFYTHDHADHVHGIDELRPLYFSHKEGPIPIYGNQDTIIKLERRFPYLFVEKSSVKRPDLYPEILHPYTIDLQPFNVFGITVQAFEQDHGHSTTMGYRFDNVAYSTDVVSLDDGAFEVLQAVDTWFVDCLSRNPRPTHAHLDLALSWIERVKPKRAILIHMNQNLDYETLRKELPKGVEPAYDGMVVEV